jgi:hypothetical protein
MSRQRISGIEVQRTHSARVADLRLDALPLAFFALQKRPPGRKIRELKQRLGAQLPHPSTHPPLKISESMVALRNEAIENCSV